MFLQWNRFWAEHHDTAPWVGIEAPPRGHRGAVMAGAAVDPVTAETSEPEAFALWASGSLRPWRIIAAFHRAGIGAGDWVDVACNASLAAEEVDLWEDGLLYPKWEHVVRLAALTGTPLAELLRDDEDAEEMRQTLPYAPHAAQQWRNELRSRYLPGIADVTVSVHPEGRPLEPGVDIAAAFLAEKKRALVEQLHPGADPDSFTIHH